jgi:hypothetical protein
MLSAYCTLALAFAAPLATALTLETPTNWVTSSRQTIRWTNQQGDPSTWSFELVNDVFHNAFALANNIDPASNSVEFILGQVPVGGGYVLQAVNIGNISDVYASTGSFNIGANPNATAQSSSGTGSSTGTGTSTSGVAGATQSTAGANTATRATGAGTGTGSGSSASASSTPFNGNGNGAGQLKISTGSYAVAVLGAIAGVAVAVL